MINLSTSARYYAPFIANMIALALLIYAVGFWAQESKVLLTIASAVGFMIFLYMTICDVVATRRALRRLRNISRA